MSTRDTDATSRLSSALDRIFSGGTAAVSDERDRADDGAGDPTDAGLDDDDAGLDDTAAGPDDGDDADDASVQPYVLPEIVLATEDPPIDDAPDEVVPSAPAQAVPTLPPVAGVAPRATIAPTAPSPTTPTMPVRQAAPTPGAAPARQTAWGDHLSAAPAGTAALRAHGRRPRVRRVTRVVRHVDPWSTFKVALLFSAVTYVVVMTAGVLLWRVADDTGTLANVERWFTQFGWETFELDGGAVFHQAWIIGLFGVVAATGGMVLLATLFNLVSDIVGGVRVTVLEEEVVERTITSTRRYVVRRQLPGGEVVAPAEPEDWDVDGDAPASASATGAAVEGSSDWSVDD